MRTTVTNVLVVLMLLAIGGGKAHGATAIRAGAFEVQNDAPCITTKTGCLFNTRAGLPMALRPRCNGRIRPQARSASL